MTTTSETLAVADEHDLLATISRNDLETLLEVARVQMDGVDAEEAEAYGLTSEDCARLWQVATDLGAAIAYPAPAPCRHCGAPGHLASDTPR